VAKKCNNAPPQEPIEKVHGAVGARRRECPRRDKEIGFYLGTFFEGARLTPLQVFRLSFFWMKQMKYDDIKLELEQDGKVL
jgi:hypothetical protein